MIFYQNLKYCLKHYLSKIDPKDNQALSQGKPSIKMKFAIRTECAESLCTLKYTRWENKLTMEENLMINFLHPDVKLFCDRCLSILKQEDISILVEQWLRQKQDKVYRDYCVNCFCYFLKANIKASEEKIQGGKHNMKKNSLHMNPPKRNFNNEGQRIYDQQQKRTDHYQKRTNHQQKRNVPKDRISEINQNRRFKPDLNSPQSIDQSKQLQGKYYVRTPTSVALTYMKWRVSDDVLLLEAIKKFGYGNWSQINIYMQIHGCFIRGIQFNRHFLYLMKQINYSHRNHPLFNNYRGFSNLSIKQNNTDIGSVNDGINSIVDNNDKLFDHFVQWVETKHNITKPHFFLEKQSKQNQQHSKNQHTENLSDQNYFQKHLKQSVSIDSDNEEEEIPYYRAQREQFLMDYEPYAQSMVANLQFRQESTQEEVSLKEQLLVAYNQKVRQRKKRKLFALENNMIQSILNNQNLPSVQEQSKKLQQSQVKSRDNISKNHPHKLHQPRQFFLNRSTNNQIISFINSFNRFFLDKNEIARVKTLMNNYDNLKTILSTFSYLKKINKQSKLKLQQLQQLRTFLQKHILPEMQKQIISQESSAIIQPEMNECSLVNRNSRKVYSLEQVQTKIHEKSKRNFQFIHENLKLEK